MNAQSARWPLLAQVINDCMDDLNMSQADLIRESGLSEPTVRGFMSGDPRGNIPHTKTLRKLETALLWPRGAVRRILGGEDPDRVIESRDDTPLAPIRRLVVEPEGLPEFRVASVAKMQELAAEILANANLIDQLRVDVDGLLERERRRFGQESG